MVYQVFETGETLWTTDRSEFPRNYCTPVIWNVGGKKQIVVAATLRATGLEAVACDARQLIVTDRSFGEARVDTIDRPLLERMKEAGCCRIGFGVESGSKRILRKVIRKRVDLDSSRDSK